MRILVVDDDDVTRKLLKEVLIKDGYEVSLAESGEAALSQMVRERFAVVLSDIRMLEVDGVAVLQHVKKISPGTVVILMTGFGSMDGAIEAIRKGAFDYVSKPFKIQDLKALVGRAVKHWELSRQGQDLGVSSSPVIDATARELIGKSSQMVEVYKTLARAALSDSNVLVTGEAGTGKELVARGIHENSQRRSRTFVPVNCGALAEMHLEAALFCAGGLLEEADGGTLFLDEIAHFPVSLQVRLLRAIQDQEFKPTGSSGSVKVNVRVIAATHDDLDALVKSGRFREDLFYRLKAISIELPPLRSRMEDLPDLVSHFLARYGEKSRKAVSHVSEEAMELLRAYPWPGNIRELDHWIERAVAMTGATVLYPEDFPEIPTRLASTERTLVGSLEDIERTHILKVLQEAGFNKSKASEILGIDRATLYRKAQRYGIELRK